MTIKRYKKTYGILHLTEKHTVFYLGKTKVNVSFTGGIVTKKGVTPATFTTDNPIVQVAIENSADFKKGVIRLQSQYLMHGEVKIGKNATKKPEERTEEKTVENPEPTPEPTSEPTPEPTPEPCAEEIPEEIPEVIPEVTAVASEEADSGEQEAEDATGLEVVDASCKDVAKQYLQEHYGENPAPLRTRADVQECAARHGITFNFV